MDARQTYGQWPLLPRRWQVSLVAGLSRPTACVVQLHKKQARVPHGLEECRVFVYCILTGSYLVYWLFKLLSGNSRFGFEASLKVTSLTDFYWTCAKVGLVRFSREKRLLLKCLMVSLRPTTKMSLYSLSSTADGKLHFWYSSLTTVGDCWMLIPGSCFKRQGKLWVDCTIVSFPS